MPLKTGGSHAAASFGTLLVGALLSKFVWQLAPPVGEAALFAIELLQTLGLGIPTNEQFAGTLVMMVGLSFVWGIVYHFKRH